MPDTDWGPAEGLRQMAKRLTDLYDRFNKPIRTPTEREADTRANDAYRREMLRNANQSIQRNAESERAPARRTTGRPTTYRTSGRSR